MDLLAQLCWASSFNSTQTAEAIPVPPHFIWLLNHSPIQLHTSSFYSPTLTPPASLQTCDQLHCLLCLFFFPSVIPSWNNLLLNTVLATSHSAFKSKIKLNSNLILYNLTVLLCTCISHLLSEYVSCVLYVKCP